MKSHRFVRVMPFIRVVDPAGPLSSGPVRTAAHKVRGAAVRARACTAGPVPATLCRSGADSSPGGRRAPLGAVAIPGHFYHRRGN